MAGIARHLRTNVMRFAAAASVFGAALTAVLTVHPVAAQAQIGSDRYSSIIVDAATGNVLEAANPDAIRHPASLAKLMTLYMVFEALRDRRIGLDELVPISGHAASMEPTKIGLMPGMQLTVEQGILALVTKSANDAAAALGEMLGGSEDRFAEMMTLRAKALGMTHSTFTNASGLPDPDAWTSARDMAILARHILLDFPGDYPYFSTQSFRFHRQVIYNHDGMLRSYPGADGMKTGYTEASGHNLVTSAVHSNVRLIGVVLGAASNPERDVHMAMLLNQGFDEMGVAPERRTAVASRIPTLISTAHAATLDTSTRPQPRGHAAVPPTPLWAIQVGSFGNEKAARDAASVARQAADGGAARVETISQHGRKIWRAQVVDLTGPQAQSACSALARHGTSCMVLRPDQRQMASR
jgi:D-alanyl-D-alanine carboxypeptidase